MTNEETNTALVQAENQQLAVPAEMQNRLERLMYDEKLNQYFMQNAALMAKSPMMPTLFRGDIYGCYALQQLAYQWEMMPALLAPGIYKVSADAPLSLEGKTVKAIMDKFAPVKDHFIEDEYIGDWSKILGKFEERTSQQGKKYKVPAWKVDDEKDLGIILRAETKSGHKIEYKLMMTQCLTRNSTLWSEDPQLQIFYRAIARFARKYFPGILGGMYIKEEIMDGDVIDVEVVTEPKKDHKQQSKSEELLAKMKQKKGKKDDVEEKSIVEEVATAEQGTDAKEAVSDYLAGYFKRNNVPLNLLDVKRYLELDRKLTVDIDSPDLPAEWNDYIRNKTKAFVNVILDWIDKQSNGNASESNEGNLI
jgi:hypothetical protein